MSIRLRDALYAAVCYADIFDYPLTEEELQIWLPFVKTSNSFIRPHFAKREGEILRICRFEVKGEIYYAQRWGRRLIETRTNRALWSKEKWVRARRIAGLLRIIPTIRLVGVTGALAMENADADDDIDFYVVAASGTLWTTRLLTTLLLELVGLRRRPHATAIRNKVCLNMYVDEYHLAVVPKERDLFAAHEVLQMKLIWERDSVYRKFLKTNQWVKGFLPNAWKERKRNYELRIMNYGKHNLHHLYIFPFILHTSYFILRLTEPFIKQLQLRYMNRRRTTEVVSDTLIRFHPRDARVWIREKLAVRLSLYKIPLDKIFYGR